MSNRSEPIHNGLCVELPGISNYLRGEYRRVHRGEFQVLILKFVYRYTRFSASYRFPQKRSCSPRAARSRRRVGGGPEVRISPDERRGRCAAASRSPWRWRRPPPSARSATGRRAARRLRHDGTRRTQRLERLSGTARDERPRRWPPPRPTTSSTKVRAWLFLSCPVSGVAARRSTHHPRTARSFSSRVCISFSDRR